MTREELKTALEVCIGDTLDTVLKDDLRAIVLDPTVSYEGIEKENLENLAHSIKVNVVANIGYYAQAIAEDILQDNVSKAFNCDSCDGSRTGYIIRCRNKNTGYRTYHVARTVWIRDMANCHVYDSKRQAEAEIDLFGSHKDFCSYDILEVKLGGNKND